MPEIHDAAARGFSRAAGIYESSRPEYPAGAVEFLAGELALGAGRTVLDVGAGTGKLTRALVPTGATVVAVEPVAEMRATLEGAVAGAQAVDGTAEALPYPDGTVDAVVCAQAFHWFDGARALAEFHRVLRPGAALGLLWNVRDEAVPWVAAISEALEPYEGGAPRYRNMEWKPTLDATALFDFALHRSFPNPQPMTADAVVDRFASVSFVAVLPDIERAALLGRIRDLVPAGGEVVMPYLTDVWIGRRLEPS